MRVLDEKTLVYKLDRILKKTFDTNLAFHEFSAGYGIADLVLAPNFIFTKSAVKRIPLTSFESLSIFLTLEDGKMYELAQLITLFPHLTEHEIKKHLRILAINNYIQKVGHTIYRKILPVATLNPIHKVIAIEVKLTDHKNGLLQARRYQYFADESYLAILKSAEKNINREAFNAYNIGLILFDERTNEIEIQQPKQENDYYVKPVSLFAKEMMLDRFMCFAS